MHDGVGHFVEKGHDLDHLGSDTTLEDGQAQGVAELRDDAADKEDGNAIWTSVAEDGRTEWEEDVAVRQCIEQVQEQTKKHGTSDLDTANGVRNKSVLGVVSGVGQ